MPTVQSAVAEFLLAQRADGSSVTTIKWYDWLLSTYANRHIGCAIEQVTPHMIREYITGTTTEWQEESVKGLRRALHKFWKWASIEYGILNPMRNIAYPKQPKPNPQPARMEDVRLLFTNAGEGRFGIRNRAIMALLLDTGSRRNE